MLLLLILAVVVFGCAKSTFRDVPQYTIEQFVNTTPVFGSSFSHDEKHMAAGL